MEAPSSSSLFGTTSTSTWIWGGLAAYVALGWTLYGAHPTQRAAYFRPVTVTLSLVCTVVGFGVNCIDDVYDAWVDGRTAVWNEALQALQLFLRESGLEDEFAGSSSSSSRHLLPSLMALCDVQNKVQRQRRRHLRQNKDDTSTSSTALLLDLRLGQHYMRYATAVYGTQMMASTELALYDRVLSAAQDSNATWIRNHILGDRSKEEAKKNENRSDSKNDSNDDSDDSDDELEIWCDYTRDPTHATRHHAQHCLVVAHHGKQQEVVVTIRGTFSVSGIITDLAGYCEPFCGGYAHAGMATAAQETWDAVWHEILLPRWASLPHPNYSLVFTGHSLGAGVACLVNILVHHRVARHELPELQGRRIQCFAMAPPPVFAPLSAAPDAVANTVAYVHNYDVVPSLSVDAIRRLMACLGRLQTVLRVHPVWETAVRRWKLGQPPPELVQAYEESSQEHPLRELKQAPMVFIPARNIVWMEKVPKEENNTTTPRRKANGISSSSSSSSSPQAEYEAHVLDPTFYADRILDLELPDCVTDHLTPDYETAFAKLLVGK